MQKDYFCPGTGIWIWKYPDNLFEQKRQIKGYKTAYNSVSGKKYSETGIHLSRFFTKPQQNLKFISLML